jgi:metacaspase-1
MAKRALCVGINRYPRPDLELKGCVNDATGWAALLTDHYDVNRADVRVLTNAKATKAAIVAGLQDLLTGASRGDVLVFTNSSHGTYVADTDHDESLYDEAICPYDCLTDLLVDDELRTLFADVPTGVRLTVISDSCHSGSLTREPPLETPDRRRKRYIDPIALGRRGIDDVRRRATPRRESVYPESSMNELLLSGCRADQYSYDARFGRKFHGAMTQQALAIIAAAGYAITYAQLHRQLVPALRESNYDQEPQLEGRAAFKRRQLFS